MTGNCEIIDDVTEDRMRTVYFSCDEDKLIDKIMESEAYVNYTQFGQQTTITLCDDSFLQSIDVAKGLHPDEELSLDDFFVPEDSENKKEDTKSYVTSVIMYLSLKLEHGEIILKQKT